MRVRLFSTMMLVVLTTFACSSGLQVNTDWDPAADFSGIETFAVYDEAGTSGMNTFTLQRVKSAIAEAMTAKGFRKVDSADDADITIGFQVATDQRSSFQTVSTGWGGYGWHSGWSRSMAVSTSRTREQTYEVGSLIIGIADADDNLIFTSSGSKTLSSGNISPNEAQDRMNRSVARILRDFPPDN